VPNVETPEFWEKMENLVTLNKRLVAIGESDAPDFVKSVSG
jgi:hypothetical protein